MVMNFALCSLLVFAQIAGTTAAVDECDQNMCRSPDGLEGYDCLALGPNTPEPFDCADGYEPVDLSSVFTLEYPEYGTLRYYTCCPPGSSSPILQECTADVCSSPDGLGGKDCWADAKHEPMTCDGDFPFPHKTTGKFYHNSQWYWHYLCCKTNFGTRPLRKDIVTAEGVQLALSTLALCLNLVLILGIIFSQQARTHSYNIYVVVLAIPDVAMSCTGIAATSGTISGGDWYASCNATQFFVYFHATANMWLNTVVAHQIYILLRNSRGRRRTSPPSFRMVCMQTAAVYFFACLVGTWGSLFTCGNIDGVALNQGDTVSTLALALTSVVVAFIPCAYLFFICVRVWKGKLLPLSGRTRALSIYFLRVVLVFLVCWIPGFILANLEGKNLKWNFPVHYVYSYLGLIQAILSAGIAQTKPDVHSAVKDFLMCRWMRRDKNDAIVEQTQWNLSSFARGASTSTSNSSLMIYWRKFSKRSTLGFENDDDEENNMDEEVGSGKTNAIDKFQEDEEMVSENSKVVVADEANDFKVGDNCRVSVTDEEADSDNGKVQSVRFQEDEEMVSNNSKDVVADEANDFKVGDNCRVGVTDEEADSGNGKVQCVRFQEDEEIVSDNSKDVVADEEDNFKEIA